MLECLRVTLRAKRPFSFILFGLGEQTVSKGAKNNVGSKWLDAVREPKAPKAPELTDLLSENIPKSHCALSGKQRWQPIVL